MCFGLASYIENWPIFLRICENYKDNIDSDISNIVLNINIKRNRRFIKRFATDRWLFTENAIVKM